MANAGQVITVRVRWFVSPLIHAAIRLQIAGFPIDAEAFARRIVRHGGVYVRASGG